MSYRIAIVVPALDQGGGVPAVALFIRKALSARSDCQIKWISLATSSSDPCSVRLSDPSSWFRGVGSRTGDFAGELFTHVGAVFGEIETQRLRPRAALAKLVADCDLIQVVAGAPCWSLSVAGLGVPVVTQAASLVRVERRRRVEIERGLKGVWRRFMTRATAKLDEQGIRRSDAILVENTWMYAYAEAKAHPPQIVRFAPPGVDTTHFKPLPKRAPERGYILTVGRLDDPRKNVRLLLEAYGLMCAGMKDPPKLVLAGSSGPDEAFWRRASELRLDHRIEFREAPDAAALAALYRGAQSFVLASDEEGFGVVVIEAMASGVPVISTRSGGPETVILDGANGFLTPRNDAVVLAERMTFLAAQPEQNLAFGRRARKAVEGRYSQAIAAKAYLDLYDEMLANSAHRRGRR